MIVDDNVDAGKTLGQLLRLSGHEVHVAFGGHAALEAAAEFQPEVVLVDLGMPGMDGHEVARRLRQLPGLTKVTLASVSGYGRQQDQQQSTAQSFVAHFVKPVKWQDVEAWLAM